METKNEVETHNRNCLRCQEEMAEVDINPGGGAILIETRKSGFFKGKISGVSAFICTKCGYVELVADHPSIFKAEN